MHILKDPIQARIHWEVIIKKANGAPIVLGYDLLIIHNIWKTIIDAFLFAKARTVALLWAG